MSTNQFSLADMAVSDMGTFTTAVALMPGNTHTKPYPQEAKNMMIEVVEVYKKNGGNVNDKVAAAEAMKVYNSWVNQNPHMDKPKKATLRDMLSNAKLTVVVSDDGQKELCYGLRRYPSVEQLYEVAVPCLNRHLESGMKLFTKFETVNLLLFRNIRTELCLHRFEVNNEVLRLLAASCAERLIATNTSEPPRPSTDVSSLAVVPRASSSMVPPIPLPPGLSNKHQVQLQQAMAHAPQGPGANNFFIVDNTKHITKTTTNTYKANTLHVNNKKEDDSESEADCNEEEEDDDDDEDVENKKPKHKKNKSVVFADSDVVDAGFARLHQKLDEMEEKRENDNKKIEGKLDESSKNIEGKLDEIKTPLKSQSVFTTPVRNNASSTGLSPTALFQEPALYSSDHLLAKFVTVEKEKHKVSNMDQLKAIADVREELDGDEQLPAVIVAHNNEQVRQLVAASLGGGPGRVIGKRVVIYEESVIFITTNDLFDEGKPYEGKDIDEAQDANDTDLEFFESFVMVALGYLYKNSMEVKVPKGVNLVTFASTKSHFKLEDAISSCAVGLTSVDGLKEVLLVSDVSDGAGTFSIESDALNALASIPTCTLAFQQVTLSLVHLQRLTTSKATLSFDRCSCTRSFQDLLLDSYTFEGRAQLKLVFKGDLSARDSIGKIPFKFSDAIRAVERGNIASLFLNDFQLRDAEELSDLKKLHEVAQANGVKLELHNINLKEHVNWFNGNIMKFLKGNEKDINALKEAALGSKVREGERAQKELLESRKGKSTTSQSTVTKQTSKESAKTAPKETRKETGQEPGKETAKDIVKDPDAKTGAATQEDTDTKTSMGTQENSASETEEKAAESEPEIIRFKGRTIIDGKVQIETTKGSGEYRDCTKCVAAKNGWQNCASHKGWYREYSRSTNANL